MPDSPEPIARPPSRRVSRKLVLGVTVAGVILSLVAIGTVVVWHSGWTPPESFYSRQTGIQLCLQCGRQFDLRYIVLFEAVPIRSQGEKALRTQRADASGKCDHITLTVYAEEVGYRWNLSKRRWSLGSPTNSAFWDHSALLQVFATLSSTNVDAAFGLYHHLNKSVWAGSVPPTITAGLSNAAAGELFDILVQDFERARGPFPQPK